MGDKANRNDPCPCGSGKKFKNCCYGKGIRFHKKDQSKYLIWLIIGAGIIIAGVVISDKFSSSSNQPAPQITPPASTQSSGAQTSNTQPAGIPQPGQAPPGKVWSQEHGHWHDISNPATPTQTTSEPLGEAPPGKLIPKPLGQDLPGKVWSEEHGHWHDAPQTPTPQVIEVKQTPSDS
jgi:hypothetical protein